MNAGASERSTMRDISIRVFCYSHVDLPAEFFAGVPIHSGEGRPTAAMLYTLLSERDEHGTIHHHLVDCGFDEPWIPRFGFYDYELPEVVLGKAGVRPEDIETVFVTHMHFDHVNNLHRFPNAKVVVQWAEYEGWSRAMGLPKLYSPMGEQSWLTSSFDRGDLAFFGRLAGDHRLTFAGDGDVLHPGIVGRLSARGHTFGIQWLTIETPEGPLVVGSDASMWFSNIEEMWPSGYTNGDTFQMLMTYGEISQYVNGDLDRVIPGHDMKVFDRHPSKRIGANEVAELRVASWDTSILDQG
jgi:glyoxylase-like metal-dependent hydrolase (beta-lactamase superfamily II)